MHFIKIILIALVCLLCSSCISLETGWEDGEFKFGVNLSAKQTIEWGERQWDKLAGDDDDER